MEINGVAHTFITASDFEASVAFYRQLLPFLGMHIVADTPNTFYGVGGRTGFGSTAPRPSMWARATTSGVSACTTSAGGPASAATSTRRTPSCVEIGAKIVHGPQDDAFAPGYYSVLFEDPDGIRLEINHVPGRGLFDTAKRQARGARAFGRPRTPLLRAGGASERQDVALPGVGQVADVGAEPEADAGADRGQHDVVGPLVVHAQAADEIGRALDAREALEDRRRGSRRL